MITVNSPIKVSVVRYFNAAPERCSMPGWILK